MNRRSFLHALAYLSVTACRRAGTRGASAEITPDAVAASIDERLAEGPVDYISALEATPTILRRTPAGKIDEMRRRLRESPDAAKEMNALRVAALVKLKAADVDPKVKRLMLDAQLEKVPHAVTTCMEHFLGVHGLLKEWGKPDDVANVGLLHAVYGTEYFDVDLLDYRRPADRARVRGIVGDRTERWVAQYALMLSRDFVDATERAGRPAAELAFFEDTPAVPKAIAPDDFFALAELQVANAYEPFTQTGKPGLLGLVFPYVPLRSYVSSGAKAAIDRATAPRAPG